VVKHKQVEGPWTTKRPDGAWRRKEAANRKWESKGVVRRDWRTDVASKEKFTKGQVVQAETLDEGGAPSNPQVGAGPDPMAGRKAAEAKWGSHRGNGWGQGKEQRERSQSQQHY